MLLYIAKDKKVPHRLHAGSVLCVNLANEVSKDTPLKIIECSLGNKPAWLVGTPTLYDETSGDTYTGSEAVTMLQGLALSSAEKRGAASVAESSTRTSRRASTSMIPPGVQLREETQSGMDMTEDTTTKTPEVADELWESHIGNENENEDEGANDSFDKKMSSDDLSRALQNRQRTNTQVSNDRPPAPSLSPLE